MTTDLGDGPNQPMPGGVDPRIWARRSAVVRSQDRRRLRWVVPIVVAAVLMAAGLALLHSPFFEARHRRVIAIGPVPAGAATTVWAAAGISPSTPLVDISTRVADARIEQLPWVQGAEVHRHWPDSVTVSVTAGAPVAVLGSGPTAVAVDAQGRVLGLAASVGGSAQPVVLTGAASVPAPGHEVGSSVLPGVAVAAAVPPVLRARVQSVAVAHDGSVSLTLSGGVVARFGPANQLEAKFESLAAVLSDPQSAPSGPATVDVEDPGEPTVGPPSAVSAGQPTSA